MCSGRKESEPPAGAAAAVVDDFDVSRQCLIWAAGITPFSSDQRQEKTIELQLYQRECLNLLPQSGRNETHGLSRALFAIFTHKTSGVLFLICLAPLLWKYNNHRLAV